MSVFQQSLSLVSNPLNAWRKTFQIPTTSGGIKVQFNRAAQEMYLTAFVYFCRRPVPLQEGA
jgi:hypothetical protein